MGVGSVRTLHGFYQTRVLRYYEQVFNKCASLQDEYSSLAVPVHRSASDSEIIRYVLCIVKHEYHVMGCCSIRTVVCSIFNWLFLFYYNNPSVNFICLSAAIWCCYVVLYVFILRYFSCLSTYLTLKKVTVHLNCKHSVFVSGENTQHGFHSNHTLTLSLTHTHQEYYVR